MKIGKHNLDLAQAIVLASIVLGALVSTGIVLTWGPDDSRTLIAEWGAAIGGVLGATFLAFRAGILRPAAEELEDDDDTPSGGSTGAALLLVALACAAASSATACGGVPREARVGAEQLAVGVDRADELVVARVRTGGDAARRTVLEELVAGVIASVEAGERRFDELLASEIDATHAVEGARRGLLSLEAALDAWDAGAADAGFLAAAACALVALLELAGAIQALGLELPEELEAGIAFVRAFASGACPAPSTSGGELEAVSS